MEPMDVDIEEPGTSAPTPTIKMKLENELTNKFLCGEMSFADYSSEWYEHDEDEDGDSDEEGKENDDSHRSETFKDNFFRRKRKFRLSVALLGLMGEANLRFVRGDKEMAEKMCHEIIKQAPTAPEPYQTLAQIYENDPEKSLQFSLLAAHLSPSDANEWLRLAAISKERNDVKQEMICYTQAIKAEPHNLELHLKRINLLTALEEIKYPIHVLKVPIVKCYDKIVTSLPPNQSETIMKYAKMASKIYHGNQELERALDTMTVAYKKCPHSFKVEDINMYLELLIASKQYQTCIEVFVATSGIEIEAEIQTVKSSEDGDVEEHTNYLHCSIPDNLPIDLRSKLLICFIHLGAFSLVQTLLNDFLTNDVEKAGDLYMDIEEALSSVGKHELAMKLLDPLVKNTSFDLGAVWLKYAECLHKLGKMDEAIQSYYRVLKHAPQHPDARRKLYVILEERGSIDEALNILQQDTSLVISPSLLYEQCCMLKKYNKELQYLKAGEDLLSRTFGRYRHPHELNIACMARSSMDLIHNSRTLRGENIYSENDLHFDEDDPFKFTPTEEWVFFKDLYTIANQHKQYQTMQRLCFGAFLSKALAPHRQEIEFYCLQSCLLAGDYQNGFRFVKEYVSKGSTIRSWNLMNLFLNEVDDNIQHKYILRIFAKETSAERVLLKNLFLGNNLLTSGRYLAALKNFFGYHNHKKEPLTALLIGITILVMAAQRTVDKHHNLILQGISYLLSYQDMRQCDQETNYNLGRAYQMLNINNLAIEYYERALACPPVVDCPTHGLIDLTKEIAYNLFTLYKDHSPQVARYYMFKYLVV